MENILIAMNDEDHHLICAGVDYPSIIDYLAGYIIDEDSCLLDDEGNDTTVKEWLGDNWLETIQYKWDRHEFNRHFEWQFEIWSSFVVDINNKKN